MEKDIRWIQRFNNFNKALASLQRVVNSYYENDALEEVEKVGMIKYFEMAYELAWNTMKDYYEDQGETGIQGSKDAIKLSHTRGLITDGQAWFEMVDSRRLSVHTYNEATANEVVEDIVETYMDLFIQLQTRLQVAKLNA